jgi:hypothetical protein
MAPPAPAERQRMPDLYSHATLAYVLPEKWRLRLPVHFFVAGSVLPDLFAYVPMKLLIGLQQVYRAAPKWIVHLFTPWHSPAAFIPACYFLSLFFEEKERARAFYALSAGSLFHLFIDLFQYQFDGGYFVFYPFSSRTFQFGLVPADLWMLWTAGATVLLLVKLLRKRRGKGGRNGAGFHPAPDSQYPSG